MCESCGCSDNTKTKLINLQSGVAVAIESASDPEPMHEHVHEHALSARDLPPEHHHHSHHDHDHGHAHSHSHHHHDEAANGHTHAHSHSHSHGATVRLETDVLAKNNRLAERNRGWFAGRNIFALNLMSAPGAGKTTLLERTIADLKDELAISVVEGDQETINDAERIRATGCRAVQINTGTGCHLDAVMLEKGLQQLDPPANSVVLIENVGNLVCPALFDLGERSRIVIASVTEGDDKPVKYPHMFRQSEVMILNKIDLLPYVPFNVDRCVAYAREVNPHIRVIQISALRGDGLDEWYDWLRKCASDNLH
jgi:hydrogenase nickel incorporation protein HypB